MNPFEVLGIASGASPEDIKAAYHRLAKQWHPDRFSGPEKAQAEDRFRQLAEAFNMLKDTRSETVAAPAPSPAPVAEPAVPPSASTQVKERTAAEWFHDAQEAFAHKDYDRSLGLAHYCIRMDEEKAPYLRLLAKSLDAKNGDQKAMVKAYESVLRMDPKDVETTIRLAEIFREVGMHARANTLWERAKSLDPQHKVFKAEARKTAALTKQAPPSDLLSQVRQTINKWFNRG